MPPLNAQQTVTISVQNSVSLFVLSGDQRPHGIFRHSKGSVRPPAIAIIAKEDFLNQKEISQSQLADWRNE